MASTNQSNQFRFTAIALLVGTFAAYSSVFHAGFVNYDDLDYVTNNPHIKGGINSASILWAFTTGHASNWHPLTWISLMLDWQLYGLRPGGFHFTNLLLHAANSVLLLAVLEKMTKAPWRSAFVAALFAWHPLHVESVAWIAERKDVLSGFFWLLTMLCYWQYTQESIAKSGQAKKLYALTLVFFICGLLAKPMVVTLPFALLLMDYWPLQRIANFETQSDGPKPKLRSTLLFEKVPFFVLAAVSSIATFAVQKSGGAVAPLEVIPLSERIPNALVAYVTYLRKLFWPNDLAVFYPFEHHLAMWQWLGAVFLLAAISGIAIVLLKKRPYVAVGWFWYLGTLVPVIGLVQVGEQALADRYTYLPFIGIFIVLAWGMADLTQTWPGREFMLKAAATIVLGICLVLTVVQAGYWKDSMTLFTHALAVTKDNAVAHANVGEALDKQGRVKEAEDQFQMALKIDPNSAHTLNGLGVLSVHEGNPAKAIDYFNSALQKRPGYSDAHYGLGNLLAAESKFAEAADQYSASIRSRPDSADAHNNLGAMWVRLGKPSEAVDEFKMALNIFPDFPEAHAQLGAVLLKLGHKDVARMHYAEAVRLKPDFVAAHLQLGLLQAQNNELDAAVDQFLAAVKYDATNAEAYYNLAAAYAAQRRLDLAATNFAYAARLDPKDSDTWGRLGAVLAVQGKSAEAANAFREALRLRPDSPRALRDLAWLLATSPQLEVRNGADAVTFAERANKLTAAKPNPRFLEALDVAYAEDGRFDDAIRTAEKVQQLATAAKQKDVADRAAQRIVLYKAGKPYHQ